MLYLFDYNQEAFYMLTKCVNNVLRLRNSIEIFYDANKVFPENSCQITEQADILVTECMNNMHSFIFSIPKMNKLYEEHNRLQTRLFVLLRRHTDFLRLACEMKRKQEGISSTTKFISKNDVPRGYVENGNTFNIFV
jgi:hypothetical protein